MDQQITKKSSVAGLFFLVGFMGSGKSMLSRGVRDSMEVVCIEMDDEIEQAAGMSITEIFKRGGEDEFRRLEKQTLRQLIENYRHHDIPVVISTGGGAPCFFDNLEVMKQAGTTIFINPSVERLVDRLEHKSSERPLIKGKNRDELRGFIRENLAKRLPFYIKSHIHINPIYDDKALNVQLLKDILVAASALFHK